MAATLATISPGVSWHTLVTGWQVEPLALAALVVDVVIAGAYLCGTRRLAARGRRWDPWRTRAFMAGMAVVVLAVNSGLASYDDSVFVVHVAQHLLLMSVAPVLIALGAPLTLVLQAARRPAKRQVLRALNSVAVRGLTFPALTWALSYLTMFAYFLTPLYALSLRHRLLHDYSHLQFLVVGVLFWMPVVGLDRSRWHLSHPMRLLYLFAGIPFTAFLGISLMSTSAPISPAHTLADVHAGGAVLWAFGEVTTVAALGIVLAQWARHEERKAVRDDRRLDAALARGSELPAAQR